MLPLDFSRDMLTLKHFFKIQSLPNSPTQLQEWSTSTNYTHNTRYKPPRYPPIRICPFLESKKQGLLDEEMRAIFLEH